MRNLLRDSTLEHVTWNGLHGSLALKGSRLVDAFEEAMNNNKKFGKAQIISSPKHPSSKIYRSDLNGENVIIIAKHKIGLVSGIAVHHARSQLFWVDRSQELIVRSSLNGSDRSVFRRVHQPLTINIYEDSIYWIMGSTRTLLTCPLYDAIPCQPVPFQPSNVENFLVISHITSQPYGEC
ncbi:hypothetical protein PV325_012791 [Microctonus aethiopoides]|nr:hypothetical protein PV325_012791 [Microctonus aethiopoides]